MTKIVYEECPYCKSKELSYGYQVGDACLKLGVSGVFGSNIIHTICLECGSIIHSRVEKPEMFRTNAIELKQEEQPETINTNTVEQPQEKEQTDIFSSTQPEQEQKEEPSEKSVEQLLSDIGF